MHLKFIAISLIPRMGVSYQLVSPIFVDYNGVCMDVVIDQQSTAFDHVAKAQPPAQRIQAQQKLYRIEHIAEDQKLAVATQN
jgi:hypothetical protein